MEKREELNAIFQNESSTLYLGDCRLILGQIISKYKDRKMIIVTDPPFNIGYKYNIYKDNLKEVEYYELLESIVKGTPSVVIHYPESLYKIALKESGHKVIYTHIYNGQDFFEYEPKQEYDYIISNPPFSQKLNVLEKCYKLGKPFALLLNLECLNYQEVGSFFINKDLQLLIVDKKVSFDGNTASFNTSYFCKDMLPKDLIFYHLEHNNAGKNFIKSRMKI